MSAGELAYCVGLLIPTIGIMYLFDKYILGSTVHNATKALIRKIKGVKQ